MNAHQNFYLICMKNEAKTCRRQQRSWRKEMKYTIQYIQEMAARL